MYHFLNSDPNRVRNYTNQDSETTMSTYNDGYRKGVEDATQPLYPEPHNGFVTGREANNTLGARRKSLLTKKVTKYFAVYDNGNTGVFKTITGVGASVDSYKTTLFETADEASESLWGFIHPIGVFQIEVEIPL